MKTRNFNVFGDNLRRLRIIKHLTLKKLGELSGVGYNKISCYEQHRCMPMLYTAVCITDALGVTIDEMFEEEAVSLQVAKYLRPK